MDTDVAVTDPASSDAATTKHQQLQGNIIVIFVEILVTLSIILQLLIIN